MLEMGSRCAMILTPWDSEGGKKNLAHLSWHPLSLLHKYFFTCFGNGKKVGMQGGQRAEVPRSRRSQRYTVEEEATWADHWEMLASRKVGVVLRSLTEEKQLRTFLRNARGFAL